ncbi:vanadium-dependent haloperoxidase [Chryseolinea sp. T2]|uniref:vanadium-dependent haloperoxidase n=1 Tax=Chryseolinea sp. T2 TaxID=3129255 RepID=UPI003078382A
MKKGYRFFCLMALTFVVMSGFESVRVSKTEKISDPESGKLLTDWIGVHLKLIRATKGLSQGGIFRHQGYASIAVYETILSGDKGYLTMAGQLQGLEPVPAAASDKKLCWQAGANAAMASVLRSFYGSSPAAHKIDSLEKYYQGVFERNGFSAESIKAGADHGATVASHILSWAKEDGSAKTWPTYEIPKGDGLWEPTPPAFSAPAAPYAYNNRTCVKNSTENTLPVPPTKFSADPGSTFYAMVDEVYQTSLKLTDAQKSMALFWDDFPDGKYYGAGGHWASIFSQLVPQKQLSLMTGTVAYVKMNIALMDAFNATWKGKYTYNVLRPVTYIQKHMGHTEWNPLIVTPAHPEYPAAHASVSMAAATALTNALGDNVAFTDHTYDDLGFAPRNFKSINDAGKEAGLSRLYGGIHYRPSIDAGYLVGSKTAMNVLAGISFRKKGV